MKVLQVNVVYGKGSTGKITYDIHKELLNKGIDSVVCYGRGEMVNEANVYKICSDLYAKLNKLFSMITGIMYGGCFFSTRKLINIIKKEKPDIVHLHCINGNFINVYKLVNWLKNNNIKTVLTLHAEFMFTANCGHSYDCDAWKKGCRKCPRYKEETKSLIFDNTHKSWDLMYKAFDGFNDNLIVTSVSPWLMNRASQSLILENKIHTVNYNGVDTTVFHPYDNECLKKRYNITNEKIIFHATPNFNDDINHIKGGYYIIELANRYINKNIKIFVAGTYKKDLKVPDNIILLGNINNQIELAKYYSLADVTVLTSKRETFSMVAAESLCCGTPVVGFKAGGPESIALQQYSSFVNYGDINGLEYEVTSILKKEYKNIVSEAKENYSRDIMTQNYIQIYKKMVGNKK